MVELSSKGWFTKSDGTTTEGMVKTLKRHRTSAKEPEEADQKDLYAEACDVVRKRRAKEMQKSGQKPKKGEQLQLEEESEWLPYWLFELNWLMISIYIFNIKVTSSST